MIYICPFCSAANSLAPSDSASCKACGRDAPRELMPTIQLARGREMPRLIHAAIVLSVVIATLFLTGLGVFIGVPFAILARGEGDAWFVPMLGSGVLGMFYLGIALGFHWERPWGRHLGIAGVLLWSAFALRRAYLEYSNGDLARIWPYIASDALPAVAVALFALWYLYFRARTRAYYRAIAAASRAPKISATGAGPQSVAEPRPPRA